MLSQLTYSFPLDIIVCSDVTRKLRPFAKNRYQKVSSIIFVLERQHKKVNSTTLQALNFMGIKLGKKLYHPGSNAFLNAFSFCSVSHALTVKSCSKYVV